jgi:pilus assembly protein CpaB
MLISVLALVFGGSAAVGVNQFIKSPPRTEVVSVVVAAGDIPRGQTLTADLLKTRDFPKDFVPAGAITKPEDAIDRTVAIPLSKEDAVLDNKVTPKGAGRGMAALIPRGMRAFTILVPNVASGVAGFMLPGNKVDVLLTLAANGPADLTGGGSTTSLLQNVEILAVDQKIDAPSENRIDAKEMRSVTLLVTPNQANLLDLAQNRGLLHLALRNWEDRQPSGARATTMLDLQFHTEKPWDQRAKEVLAALGEAMAKVRPATPPPPPPPPVAAKAEPAARKTIRTIRGSLEGLVVLTPDDGS